MIHGRMRARVIRAELGSLNEQGILVESGGLDLATKRVVQICQVAHAINRVEMVGAAVRRVERAGRLELLRRTLPCLPLTLQEKRLADRHAQPGFRERLL